MATDYADDNDFSQDNTFRLPAIDSSDDETLNVSASSTSFKGTKLKGVIRVTRPIYLAKPFYILLIGSLESKGNDDLQILETSLGSKSKNHIHTS